MGQEGGPGEGLEGESLGDLSPTYACLSVLPGLTRPTSAFPQGEQIDRGGENVFMNTSHLIQNTYILGQRGPHFLQ